MASNLLAFSKETWPADLTTQLFKLRICYPWAAFCTSILHRDLSSFRMARSQHKQISLAQVFGIGDGIQFHTLSLTAVFAVWNPTDPINCSILLPKHNGRNIDVLTITPPSQCLATSPTFGRSTVCTIIYDRRKACCQIPVLALDLLFVQFHFADSSFRCYNPKGLESLEMKRLHLNWVIQMKWFSKTLATPIAQFSVYYCM